MAITNNCHCACIWRACRSTYLGFGPVKGYLRRRQGRLLAPVHAEEQQAWSTEEHSSYPRSHCNIAQPAVRNHAIGTEFLSDSLTVDSAPLPYNVPAYVCSSHLSALQHEGRPTPVPSGQKRQWPHVDCFGSRLPWQSPGLCTEFHSAGTDFSWQQCSMVCSTCNRLHCGYRSTVRNIRDAQATLG